MKEKKQWTEKEIWLLEKLIPDFRAFCTREKYIEEQLEFDSGYYVFDFMNEVN